MKNNQNQYKRPLSKSLFSIQAFQWPFLAENDISAFI